MTSVSNATMEDLVDVEPLFVAHLYDFDETIVL